MTYIPHRISLSTKQAHTLASGGRIQLKQEQLKGGTEVHLTTRQLAKLQKHEAAGKGMELHLSAKQLKHHEIHGAGLFSDLVRKLSDKIKGGYHAAKERVKPIIIDGAHTLADKGLEHVGEFVHEKIDKYVGKRKPKEEIINKTVSTGIPLPAPPVTPARSARASASTGGLMGEIRAGKELKKVLPNKAEAQKALATDPMSDIVNRIKERRKAIDGGGVRRRRRTQRGEGFLDTVTSLAPLALAFL